MKGEQTKAYLRGVRHNPRQFCERVLSANLAHRDHVGVF